MAKITTSKFVWMNGKLVPWNKAKIHILTHSLHYGSGVFEGIKSYKTKDGAAIFRLDDHIKRLFSSANDFGIRIGFTKGQLRDAIKILIKKNKLKNAYIRPIVYYGYGSLSVYPKNVPVETAVIAIPLERVPSNNLNLVTSKFIRIPEKSTVFGAKITGNYSNSILAMHEARKKGYDEALMIDHKGFVAEGPAQNLLLVKNGNIIAPNSASALHGITRDSIIKMSKDMGIKVYGKKIRLSEVKKADELFYCGTLAEIDPIISVDGKKIGNGKPGKITLEIRDQFYDITKGKDKKYKKWLTYLD